MLDVGKSQLFNDSTDGPFTRLKPGPKGGVDVGKHQRTRLQRAMTELVAEGGYRSVTVRKLTKLAGVSTETFYSQFDGTDDCFLTTYTELMDRVWRRLARARTCDCDRREQATRSLHALVGGFAADPAAARLTLVEVFDGGPAALAPIRAQETRLEVALKESLDRRGDRTSPTAAAWITAGVLHLSRTLIASSRPGDAPDLIEASVRWGRAVVTDADAKPSGSRHGCWRRSRRSRHQADLADGASADETELILSATIKLAMADSYWRLSESRISKAAGIPRTHFKRHFLDLEEAYLAALRRISFSLFRHLWGTDASPRRSWRDELHCGVVSLAEEVAARPATARLALSGILEPGLGGLTRRESLVGEIASAWAGTVPVAERPNQLAAEAAVASLWAAFAEVIDDGDADRLVETSTTFAHLFLLSVGRPQVGRQAAEAQAVPIEA